MLARVRRAEPAGAPALAAAATAAPTSTAGSSPSTGAPGFTAGCAGWPGEPQEELVIQDVEIPVDRLAEFLDAFHPEIGIAPVWLCPVRLRGERTWPLYPMAPGELYVNVGFWSAVPEVPGRPGRAQPADRASSSPTSTATSRSTRRCTTARTSSGEHYNGPGLPRAQGVATTRAAGCRDLYTKVTG